MRKKLLIGVLSAVLAVFLFACPAKVSSLDFCSEAKTTSVYFVNGIWTTKSEAEKIRIVIEENYNQTLKNLYPNQTFEFKVAYNYHIDKVRDVIEVITQKITEINRPAVSQISPEVYLAMYMLLEDFKGIMPTGADSLILTIEEALAAHMTAEVNSSTLIQKYEADLLEGKRVLLIPHSQGNMFASNAMQALSGEFGESIGMIGVASPAAHLYGEHSSYYTAKDDRVINLLRNLFVVLEANVDNDPGLLHDPRDFSNHQFIRSYFSNGLESKSLINQDFFTKISELVFPYAYLGSGAITVTLTWGPEPDVDLHVYEPNNNHVYYRNMSGLYGYLDLDDVSSYGPEHYYVACNKIGSGTFRVGVNYYYGSNPETAQIQISTADGVTRTFKQNLTQSLGASGNNIPIIVATVEVTPNSNGGYTYNIRQQQ